MEKQRQHSSYCCISHGFHQIASTNPNKLAIIQAKNGPKNLNSETKFSNANPPVYEGDKFFTFSELSSAVDSLSFRLHLIFNGGDDPSLIKPTSGNIKSNVTTKIIGIYMVPSVEYVIAVLSILEFGGVFLPLDPSWPKDRILSIISSSNVDIIIGCSNIDKISSTHLVDESHWLVNCCKFHVLCIDFDGVLEQKCGKLDLGWTCESGKLRNFSYLMYTSGSTGKPKGVCGTEEGVLNRFLWMQEFYPLKEDDVLLFKTSISFVDHLQEFLAPMLAGCTLVVPPFHELKGNFFGLVDFLYDYSITRITAVPSLMRALLPALEGRYSEQVMSSLKLLVLSGEVFPISLWEMLSRILPKASTILNIYGSTEVSGDCTYFDCKWLPEMLKSEMLSSVPIGKPISNCGVRLSEKDGSCDEGEICVTGVCLSRGYYIDGNIMPLDYEGLREESVSDHGCQSSKLYYRTGDFARRLPSGDLVFCGREDRTIKVNGQRIALEEVEDTLRGHIDIVDAAVISCNEQEGYAFLKAVLVLKDKGKSSQILAAVKSWMVDRLPSVMIPKEFCCTETLPMSSTGKVDYMLLPRFFSPVDGSNKSHVKLGKTLDHIKEAFCNSLGVAEIGNDDDFFAMGGDSIIAAHVAHNLGIDMRLLYMFQSPLELQKALVEKEGLFEVDHQVKWETLPKAQKVDSPPSSNSGLVKPRKHGETTWTDTDEQRKPKHLKVVSDLYSNLKGVTSLSSILWESHSMPGECAISRCNKVTYNSNCDLKIKWPTQEFELPSNRKGSLREIWKVSLESCVDASPLVTFKDNQILIFIGSHSHKFLCVNAKSGSIRWEIKLKGRVECSAMIDGDFSQVVVGCYEGNVYFVDMMKGIINWTFQTGGEVKSQPTIDKCRNLIWCGSHDHNLYALDYRNYHCVYQFPCTGSIFGSPAIDEARDMLYLGTTNGNLTAIMLKASAFSVAWQLELKAPIFGSLSISSDGHVLCCLVNGDVLSLNSKGSIVWRVKTDGPIFAGPCISKALGFQALVCSRNGNVYSFELEKGRILWKYNVGGPITSSAFVDENIKLISDPSVPSERLVCICSSSGRIILLQVSCATAEDNIAEEGVEKFAEIDLQGDVFSSPVMVGGRIFVGCRDDYLHCIVVEDLKHSG
ncbi:putative acyl-activating enzyme 19 [Chenopodium quinoa]|nr:putative acyl-activating enzyme 19 [Chenopodium quinoa]